ncbi:hypothetical protein K7432_000387 [Basidiobolus ranarum]|uniref:Uncharacterized protein n=1 Tax=Basidiobolus ranarum TaxID=34480 RepID=A0ABR2WBA1_9FUNG
MILNDVEEVAIETLLDSFPSQELLQEHALVLDNDEDLLNSTTSSTHTPIPSNAEVNDIINQFSHLTSKQEIYDCLSLNLKYQEGLKKQLAQIEEAQKRNVKMQKELRELYLINGKQPKKPPTPTTKQSFHFFAETEGNMPLDNVDTILRRQQPLLVDKFRRWTEKERQNLAKGVRQQNMKILGQKYFNQEKNKLWEVAKKSDRELEMNLEGLDWNIISKYHVPTRKPNECAIQWSCHDHPLINKEEWSKQESHRLVEIVKEMGGRNWPEIAIRLGTNRTAVSCFKQYQSKLNSAMIRNKWTEEEDNILKEAVHVYGERNWQQVAHCLDNRTGQQCLHRWSKTLNPAIRRGRWTSEEDEALRSAVEVYGPGNWVKIQQHVLGRTDVQCRERYMNVLCPNVEQGPWATEEDDRLRKLVSEIGAGKWSQISSHIEGRTDNQCWRRWKMLITEEKLKKLEAAGALPQSKPRKAPKKGPERKRRSDIGRKRKPRKPLSTAIQVKQLKEKMKDTHPSILQSFKLIPVKRSQSSEVNSYVRPVAPTAATVEGFGRLLTSLKISDNFDTGKINELHILASSF